MNRSLGKIVRFDPDFEWGTFSQRTGNVQVTYDYRTVRQ